MVLKVISDSTTPPEETTALSSPSKPFTSKGIALRNRASLVRSSAKTLWHAVFPSIPSSFKTSVASAVGTISAKTFLSFLLELFPRRVRSQVLNSPASFRGNKSSMSVTSLCASNSPTVLLRLSTVGPVIPTWVKSSFPVWTPSFLLSAKRLSLMSVRVRPASFLFQLVFKVSGTSAKSLGTTAWPSFFSHTYASPVEPVSGLEVPPVATTQEGDCSTSPLSKVTENKPSFLLQAIALTAALVFSETPVLLTSATKVSLIVLAELVVGKSRPSFSSFRSTPCSLNHWIDSATPCCANVEKRNLPAPLYWDNISRTTGLLLVTLQRPPPVIRSFFPSDGFFSNNNTRFPRPAAVAAAIIPAGPPPITITSHIWVFMWLEYTYICMNSKVTISAPL